MVTFTSNISPPAPGDWGGIFLNDQDFSGDLVCRGYFNNCIIDYAGDTHLYSPADGAAIATYGFGEIQPSVKIYNSEIRNCSGWAAYVYHTGFSADTLVVENCYVHDNDFGILGDGVIRLLKVTQNNIYNNDVGIKLHGYDHDCIVSNNILQNNGIGISTEGITSFFGTTSVNNNLISESSDYGLELLGSGDVDYMGGNIITLCTIGAFGVHSGVQYSCLSQNTQNFSGPFQGTGTIEPQDIRFVSTTDFHLKYNSPCLNAGDPTTTAPFPDPDGSRNDMGIYGGEYAWEPYYVLIPSDASGISHLFYSTYKVDANLQVANSSTLTIDAGATLMFTSANYGIDIQSSSELIAVGYDDLEITLKAYPQFIPPAWKGIKLAQGSLPSSIVEYLNIDHCENGLQCLKVTLTHPIAYCDFTDCQTIPNSCGVYLDSCNTGVRKCTFEDCIIGVGMNKSNSIVDSNAINVVDYGIYVRDGSTWELNYNALQDHSGSHASIHLVNAGGGDMEGNRISQGYTGLYVENSDPKMADNFIDECALYGMHQISGSQPVMRFNQFQAKNRIADCDSNEVHISGHLFPLINGGHNDLINNNVDDHRYVIWTSLTEDLSYYYDVAGNYWLYQTTTAIRNAIYPPDDLPDYEIAVSSFDTGSNTGYIASVQEDLIAEGIEYEMNGQYSEAYALYLDILRDYPNEPESLTAMRRLFCCVEGSVSSYLDLYADYTQVETDITNPANHFNLERSKGNALRAAGSFYDALDLFDGLLETAPNLTDSVFVLMDVENTQYELSQQGYGLNSQGSLFDEYNTRMDELRNILDNNNNPSPASTLIPTVSILVNAYPNPFNSTTAISFYLPQTEAVKLTIYDVSGRLVKNLHDGTLDVGKHEFLFDAANLSSGIYLCKLRSDNYTACHKIVLLK
ncbi:MAG: right-handed parallel beta-helix repeat-containing protein [bacterium]|nr:right-handed parallel beta-helix repeat-containing protein [bacterium]